MDAETGELFGYWPRGRLNIRVDYSAGFATVPDPVQEACVQLAADLYSQSQVSGAVQHARLGSAGLHAQHDEQDARPQSPKIFGLIAPYVAHDKVIGGSSHRHVVTGHSVTGPWSLVTWSFAGMIAHAYVRPAQLRLSWRSDRQSRPTAGGASRTWANRGDLPTAIPCRIQPAGWASPASSARDDLDAVRGLHADRPRPLPAQDRLIVDGVTYAVEAYRPQSPLPGTLALFQTVVSKPT